MTKTERSQAGRIIEFAAEHGLEAMGSDHIQRGTSFAEFKTLAVERLRNEMNGFSFARAIESVGRDFGQPTIDGFEREMLTEWARMGGDQYDPRCWHIPWNVLRDLNVGAGSAGGYLASTEVLPAIDILRPYSVTARAGAQIVQNVRGSQTLPVVNGKVTITWLDDETATVSKSTPSLLQAAGTPKIAAGLLQFSRRMRVQASPEEFIRRELLNTAGSAIDQALISGTGTLGQPLGLTSTPGIGTQSGSSLAHAGVLAMKSAVAAADVDDETISWLAPPATREVLEAREVVSTTGRFLWQDDKISARPARVSTDVPASTLIAGSWPTALCLLWGNGIQIDFNPFDLTLFKQGIVQARVLISVDTLFPHPGAFSVATSVT